MSGAGTDVQQSGSLESARLLRANGDLVGAVGQFEKTTANAPDRLSAATALRELQLLIRSSENLLNSGDIRKSLISKLRNLVSAYPGTSVGIHAEAGLASELLRAGNFSEAELGYSTLVQNGKMPSEMVPGVLGEYCVYLALGKGDLNTAKAIFEEMNSRYSGDEQVEITRLALVLAGIDFEQPPVMRPKSSVKPDTDASSALPSSFALHQNYPNPFNPSTTIRFDLRAASIVNPTVYDMLGRAVSVLANGLMTVGEKSVVFDGADLPSGVYLCRLTAGEFTEMRKIVLMK